MRSTSARSVLVTLTLSVAGPSCQADDGSAAGETAATSSETHGDSATPAETGEGTSTGDGDGEPATGDGDGDGEPATGDGDGEPATGDGDGEPATGDGDGDGEPTTGDGDGEPEPDPPEPLVFSVMGDVPYGEQDYVVLPQQILNHNQLSPSRFMVHVGDIKTGASPCVESTYQAVADILSALEVPTFVLVGDNEWNDCGDPDQAWSFWTTYFGGFHEQWPIEPVIETQPGRPENMAWVEEGVLSIAITLPGGATHDQGEWDAFLADAASWVEMQLFNAAPEVYAAVVFGHANPAAKHDPFMLPFRAAVSDFARPVLYIHGDGHVWIEDQPWPEPNLFRVQVDQGGVADPVQVTVDPDATELDAFFAFEREPF